MTIKRNLQLFPCVLVLAAVTGCTAAYHDYPCGKVPYGYCPPPPLPYASFDACLTPLAADYLSGKKSDQTNDLLAPPEFPEVVID